MFNSRRDLELPDGRIVQVHCHGDRAGWTAYVTGAPTPPFHRSDSPAQAIAYCLGPDGYRDVAEAAVALAGRTTATSAAATTT